MDRQIILQSVTDAEIYTELGRRAKVAKEAEMKRRDEHAEWVVKNAFEILKLVPGHSKTNCSDQNTCNAWDGECTRCVLIRAQQDKYFDNSLKLAIDIHLEVLPELK